MKCIYMYMYKTDIEFEWIILINYNQLFCLSVRAREVS